MHLNQVLDRMSVDGAPEYTHMVDPMRRASNLRYKDYIRETLAEY